MNIETQHDPAHHQAGPGLVPLSVGGRRRVAIGNILYHKLTSRCESGNTHIRKCDKELLGPYGR